MSIKQSDFDKGRLALERFRKLIDTRYRPLLRAVTGNDKLQVTPSSSQALTDNKTVWLPVPLALGDETLEHDKSVCGKRDASSMTMLCMMCKLEDEIDALVFHESAHITENSFEKVNGNAFWKNVYPVIETYVEAMDATKASELKAKISIEDGVMTAAKHVDPWLPFTLNVVEDIYVNRRLIKYRQGTELPLRLHTQEVFINGIPDFKSEERRRWEDNDMNAQAIISLYLIGQGLPELGTFLDPDHDLTSDPVLVGLAEAIPEECPIQDRLAIAVKVVMHLRTLGYCPTKSDSPLSPPPPLPPPPPQEEEDEPLVSDPQTSPDESEAGEGEGDEAESESEDDDEASGDGSGSKDGEDGDEDDDDEGEAGGSSSQPQSYDGEDPIEPEGSGGSGDDDEDESEAGESPDEPEPSEYQPPTDDEVDAALERARQMLTDIMGHDEEGPSLDNDSHDKKVIDTAIQQESFDHPSPSMTGGYNVPTRNSDPYRNMLQPPEVKIPRHMLTQSLARLRVVFASNRKTGLERSLKAGTRLDTMHLYRAGTDDRRIFGKRNVPKSRDWFVLVGIDMSGSADSNGADVAEKMAAHAIGELLYSLDIKFEMYAHTSGSAPAGQTLEHVLIKGRDENWKDKSVQNMLFAQKGRGFNFDGHSMEQYRKVLQSVKATDKLLLYFTDGKMPNANITEELPLLQENLEILRRMPRTQVIGLGYRTDSPKRHGLDTIEFSAPEDIASIVSGLEDRLLR